VRPFLTLESIYRFDPGVRQARLQFEDLGVVWSYDKDAGEGQRLLKPVPIDQGRVCGHDVRRAAAKAGWSDRFLEILGSAERDLLTGLDLDGLAGRRIASHAGGAMPDLQDAQAPSASGCPS